MYGKSNILDLLNDELAKQEQNYVLESKMLDTLVLDVTRAIDHKLTSTINQYKNDTDSKVNSVEKEEIRKFLLGYPTKGESIFEDANRFIIEQSDLEEAYSLIEDGFKRNENLMIESLVARIERLILNVNEDFSKQYIQYLHDLQEDMHELMIVTQGPDGFCSTNNLAEIIDKYYPTLSNYHHLIIIFENRNSKANWKSIADIAIYMENFRLETEFNLFNRNNKSRRIEDLKNFLKGHNQINYNTELEKLVKTFYAGVSYGFQFKDLFITEDGNKQVLIMQKFELDESPKKCPACFNELVRGNSYPRVLYKSFECTNPSCPARSKIGRGKRYDLLAAKRQMLLERDNDFDKINDTIYYHMRRDIIEDSSNLLEKLISLYSWSDDSVLLINTEFNNKSFKGRDITSIIYKNFDDKHRIGVLPINKLFESIACNISFNKKDAGYKNIFESNTSTVINGNSSYVLPYLNETFDNLKVKGAVTSPPYYNAREYSQWQNLLLYLVDMMINAKAVHSSMDENGVYIYNIGDVVGQDNIYIKSSMSKRRQMLGFYSIFIFELAGFKVLSNIIWDKGEVESKRNSTSNLFSGYVNPVNSYEHCFIFSKNKNQDVIPTRVDKINAVKKINSKGENILGHTAPFPEEIPELLLPFINPLEIVIDPYLGSGTSCIALQRHNIQCIGFEINTDYYELVCNRISQPSAVQITFIED